MFRFTTRDLVSFDCDENTTTRLVAEIRKIASEQIQANFEMFVNDKFLDDTVNKLANTFDNDELYTRLSDTIVERLISNYMSYMIEQVRNNLVTNMQEDSRFRVLVNRNIMRATEGFIDETVERVTARLANANGNESDV